MSKEKKYFVSGSVYHIAYCEVMATSRADALEKAKEIEASETTYRDGSTVNYTLEKFHGGPEFYWQDAHSNPVKLKRKKFVEIKGDTTHA